MVVDFPGGKGQFEDQAADAMHARMCSASCAWHCEYRQFPIYHWKLYSSLVCHWALAPYVIDKKIPFLTFGTQEISYIFQ